ncbi:uncharacterized protein LOC125679241 isoform X2 [Ostrea edulis]|uniref:uncharacterized protein LOC125679241 isoform X2 n=1 Tax=Ostrea edulis TaxID=37623 RepID=UPI002094C421|nr:uncharacterized protein LOC125679241 isoform X2 [Ostrea edulis]
MVFKIIGGVYILLFVSAVEGTCSFSYNLEGTWTIEKDGQLVGMMEFDYTHLNVTFMGQVYNYTCHQFDYQQERYLLSTAGGTGVICLMFTPFNSGDTSSLMMIRLHMTHIFNDNAFFAPQYSVGRLSMNSICSNYDDGQVLIINYVS